MILGIASAGKDLNSEIDDRFGRAEYFIIYNTEEDKFKVVENISKDDVSGAGQKAVKILYDEGVEAVVAPELGPKAKVAIKEFEIKVYKKAENKTINDAIKSFRNNSLEEEDLNRTGLRRV